MDNEFDVDYFVYLMLKDVNGLKKFNSIYISGLIKSVSVQNSIEIPKDKCELVASRFYEVMQRLSIYKSFLKV